MSGVYLAVLGPTFIRYLTRPLELRGQVPDVLVERLEESMRRAGLLQAGEYLCQFVGYHTTGWGGGLEDVDG